MHRFAERCSSESPGSSENRWSSITTLAAEATAESMRLLPYDQCVVALGAQSTLDGTPGAAEFAQPFYTADDALAVKRRVRKSGRPRLLSATARPQ